MRGLNNFFTNLKRSRQLQASKVAADTGGTTPNDALPDLASIKARGCAIKILNGIEQRAMDDIEGGRRAWTHNFAVEARREPPSRA